LCQELVGRLVAVAAASGSHDASSTTNTTSSSAVHFSKLPASLRARSIRESTVGPDGLTGTERQYLDLFDLYNTSQTVISTMAYKADHVKRHMEARRDKHHAV
jgi:hypothetical protein